MAITLNLNLHVLERALAIGDDCKAREAYTLVARMLFRYGRDHPEVALSLANLGHPYVALGDKPKAL